MAPWHQLLAIVSCSSAVTVDGLSDPGTFSIISSSRNKNGRISSCRGGSVSTTSSSSSSRMKKKKEREDQEIDRYIDFLIATYCPSDAPDEVNIVIDDTPDYMGDVPTSTDCDATITASVRDKVMLEEEEVLPVSCHASGAVKSPDNLPEHDVEEVEGISFLFPSDSANHHHQGTASAEVGATTSTFWNTTNMEGMDQPAQGGGDDDDSETEAEMLDHYIEFLQEDYDNDRALDKYIDFLEQDYDSDQALDRYIDFLLATTASSVPVSKTAHDHTPTITSYYSTPPVVLASRTVLSLMDEATSLQQRHTPTPLDIYFDQAVSAVELDEYIDRLVASVSGRDLVGDEEQDDRIVGNLDKMTSREHGEEEVLDSYVDVLITDDLKESVAEEAHASAGQLESTASTLTHLEKDLSDDAGAPHMSSDVETKEYKEEPVLVHLADAGYTEGGDDVVADDSQSKTALNPSAANVESNPATLADIDDQLKEDQEYGSGDTQHQAAIQAVETGGGDDGSGDKDDDKPPAQGGGEVAIELLSSLKTLDDIDSRDGDFLEIPVADSASAYHDGPVQQSEKVKRKKKRTKKRVASAAKGSGVAAPISDDILKEAKAFADAPLPPDEAVAVPVADESKDATSSVPVVDNGKDVTPIQAPNALYRFLLRQGPVGHVMVLVLVLVVEWVQKYVPQLADLVAFLWTSLAPAGLQRSLAPQQLGGYRGSAATSLQHLYTGGRTPVTGRQRSKLRKQADKEAMIQLQRVGDIQDAKYKHVSADFMKRHGLGSFRSEETVHYSEYEQRIAVPSSQKKTRKKAKTPSQEDDDSDVDWVRDAFLAEEKAKSSINFGVGPSMEIGVEFDLGGRRGAPKRRKRSTFDIDAITRDSVRKRASGPRASDRDGGSGVVGMIRAAATSNNLMSRSLLGAYPGDVVPPSEAGNARGVTALARKYGYGDWSSDDDNSDADADDQAGPKKPSKKKRKKKSRPSERKDTTESDDDPFDIDSLLRADEYVGEDKPQPTTTSSRRSKKSTSSRAAKRSSSRKRAMEVRPALDLLHETTKKERRRTTTSKDILSSSNSVKKPTITSSNRQAHAKLVRPAMEKLRDLEKKHHKNKEND
jgi:hypothetical protein